MENTQKTEKQNLQKKKEEISNLEIERDKELKNERLKVDRQLKKLKELENLFNKVDYLQNEENNKTRMSLNYDENKINLRIELFNNAIQSKKRELEQKKKLFEEEKKFFEKFKNDSLKNIQFQTLNINQKKKELGENEIKVKEKIKLLQDKQNYLNQLLDDNENNKIRLQEREMKIQVDENDIKIAALRINREIENLRNEEQYITLENEKVMTMYQDLENKRVNYYSTFQNGADFI